MYCFGNPILLIDPSGKIAEGDRPILANMAMNAITTGNWSGVPSTGIRSFADSVSRALNGDRDYLSVIVGLFIQNDGNVSSAELVNAGVPSGLADSVCADAILAYNANVNTDGGISMFVFAYGAETFDSPNMAVVAGGLGGVGGGKTGGKSSGAAGNKGNSNNSSANALKSGDSKAISGMSKKELQANLPEGWTYTEHNGRVHIKDENGAFRVRIAPPDKVTNYQHMHILDATGNVLDINGNVVSPKSPNGHIPWSK